jgi:hypothetical protein
MSKMISPAARWNLRIVGGCEIDGTEYVVYTDERFSWACEEADFGAPTEEEDYSSWCANNPGVSDDALVAKIAAVCGLDGCHVAGSGVWVDAANGLEQEKETVFQGILTAMKTVADLPATPELVKMLRRVEDLIEDELYGEEDAETWARGNAEFVNRGGTFEPEVDDQA